MSTKRKRAVLSIKDKQIIISRLDKGVPFFLLWCDITSTDPLSRIRYLGFHYFCLFSPCSVVILLNNQVAYFWCEERHNLEKRTCFEHDFQTFWALLGTWYASFTRTITEQKHKSHAEQKVMYFYKAFRRIPGTWGLQSMGGVWLGKLDKILGVGGTSFPK